MGGKAFVGAHVLAEVAWTNQSSVSSVELEVTGMPGQAYSLDMGRIPVQCGHLGAFQP